MRDRGRLAVMAKLAAVQRAKRVGAQAALAAARVDEREADAARDVAEAGMVDAHRDWLDHLAGAEFSPEFSRLLSGVLVGCEREADGAARHAAETSERRGERQSDWQRLDARVKSGDASLKRLRRKVAWRVEEHRLAALADRTTSQWSRS